MKSRGLSRVVIAFMLLVLAFPLAAANASNDEKARVWVQFAPGSKAQVENAVRAANAEVHYTFDDLDAIVVSVPEKALPGLQKNPNIVLIEEDVPRFPIGIERSQAVAPASIMPEQKVPYGIDMVQARDVWDADRDRTVDDGAPTGAGRKVCIIDSGLYTGHEDLEGLENVTGYEGDNLPWATDGFGHGTHVAGTIAAVNNAFGVVGVTPGTVSLYIVRVFGNDGAWAYSSTLIDAANRCQSAGANIISMSLGGARASLLERRGFDSLYSKGIFSIAAAGNAGTTAYSYPASYGSVVSVAAIDANKTVADFSQYNNQVELAAPGVGVLSTLPYIDSSTLTVDGVTYTGAHVEYSARGTAPEGALVDGGLCGTAGDWTGKVVLCQRGTYDFNTKVMSVQTGGGVAAVIYNNVSGGFLGTLGEGSSSDIVAISLSQEDGQSLVAKVGSSGTVESTVTQPGSGYEYWDGTSMATPHVSAVAALVWSAKPTATNVEIRNALTATAEDLGAAERDVYYGYGLVQAKAAVDALVGTGGQTTAVHVADLDGTTTVAKKWTATVTATIKDAEDSPVSGATVTGTWSDGYVGTGTCTTGTEGTCKVTSGAMKLTVPSVTFKVTGVTGTGLTYTAANTDPDNDSNGTNIEVTK